MEASTSPQHFISAGYTVPQDLLPIKTAAQVAGLSTLYLYELVHSKCLTRYGGWRISVSLAEVLDRANRIPRRQNPPKRARDAAGRYLPRDTWQTYDTSDGSQGCGAD